MFLRADREWSGQANNISGVVGSQRGRAMFEEGHFGLGGRCSARSKHEHKNTSARTSLCVNQTACEEWRQRRRRQTVVRVQRPRSLHPWLYRRYHTAERPGSRQPCSMAPVLMTRSRLALIALRRLQRGTDSRLAQRCQRSQRRQLPPHRLSTGSKEPERARYRPLTLPRTPPRALAIP